MTQVELVFATVGAIVAGVALTVAVLLRLFTETRFGELFTHAGHASVPKTLGIVGGAATTAVFVRMALGREAYNSVWDLFFGYAVAIAICGSPQLVAQFLGMRYAQRLNEQQQGEKK